MSCIIAFNLAGVPGGAPFQPRVEIPWGLNRGRLQHVDHGTDRALMRQHVERQLF
jgi:hypothetical protein